MQNKFRVSAKQIQGGSGIRGGQEAWTHCETDADGGSEGPWDELALVVLNQQGSLTHSAVPHKDCLQRESRRDMTQDPTAATQGQYTVQTHSAGYCTCSSVAQRTAPCPVMQCDGLMPSGGNVWECTEELCVCVILKVIVPEMAAHN